MSLAKLGGQSVGRFRINTACHHLKHAKKDRAGLGQRTVV
ncbi:hypothetical protein VCRA2114E365_10280 [Vibrio crassostreae]|nr:hypothetical protein VCRA2119O381_120016 [Vibrio crassostreae]CAK1840043.1 hypothetical protein VCRA2112O187_170038 [Vibrio crassostreae]CAK1852637.1 hypothetical protein VCRA2115O371_10280 [Vibrio crassostreae]CAK1860801.1 hypothetical protein VCRA2113O199_10280 [Vibrio crassostreae]CAK1863059.1 hypothetical protein VCRA2113O362_10280 [Vibrio crassostreae]